MLLIHSTSSRRLCAAVALSGCHQGFCVMNTTRRYTTATPHTPPHSAMPPTHAQHTVCQYAPAGASPTSGHEWEGAVQRFHDALGLLSHARVTHVDHVDNAQALRDAYEKAVSAMQCCLHAGRFQEAMNVHMAACRCGLSSLQPDSGGERAAVLDVLALAAVRQLPFRVRQSRTMLYLLDAEDDHFLQTQHPLLDTCGTSVVEIFRITLQQRLHVLRVTDQLHRPLGHQYLLSAMREVCDSPTLRDAVEPLPLVQLSSLALWHPFAYEVPSSQWARRRKHIDILGAHPCDVDRCTPAERRQLQHLSDAVSSIRPLCTSSASFLSALAPDWDALFVRRVAETLVLPEAAHDVFPAAYARTRRGARRTDLEAPAVARAAWLDGSLFREEQGTATEARSSAWRRLDAILRRRSHLDMVVPDPDFLFRHLQQLLQLAQHREVIVTHGVLLEMVDLADAPEDPRRFHARRVLLTLLRLTSGVSDGNGTAPTPATTRGHGTRQHLHPLYQPYARGRHSTSGARLRRQQSCGITILGLHDELALLERCPERFLLAEHVHRGASAVSAACLQLPGSPARSRRTFGEAGVLSALLVSRQLQRLVTAGARDADLGQRSPASSVEPVLDVDELVRGVLANTANSAAVVKEAALSAPSPSPRSPQPAPLFKQRSPAYWSRTPVVVATASPATRATAFSVGIEMYPPVVIK